MLRTSDMARTIEFYTAVLGFELTGTHPPESPSWCSLRRDRADVMFYADDPHDKSPPRMTGRLYLYTDDVLALHDRIKGHVKVVEGPEVYFYGMKEFAIEDCNGYTLAFGQETTEPPTCDTV